MDLLRRLAETPDRAAILLDVDGVLAPIVARPEDARVPRETRAVLARLALRYALVACISGRASDDARRIVGVPELTYVGNHGLELDPAAAPWRERLAAFLAQADWEETENKGVSAALHFRNVADEPHALATLEPIAAAAREHGFVTRYGRKVLEILPPLATNKGTAVARLLGDHDLRIGLYAGDDTTDLDAFTALDGLELGVRVAVASSEGPSELLQRADLVVGTPDELRELLESL
jgi:trehalose 6-phosphate phosphatase